MIDYLEGTSPIMSRAAAPPDDEPAPAAAESPPAGALPPDGCQSRFDASAALASDSAAALASDSASEKSFDALECIGCGCGGASGGGAHAQWPPVRDGRTPSLPRGLKLNPPPSPPLAPLSLSTQVPDEFAAAAAGAGPPSDVPSKVWKARLGAKLQELATLVSRREESWWLWLDDSPARDERRCRAELWKLQTYYARQLEWESARRASEETELIL